MGRVKKDNVNRGTHSLNEDRSNKPGQMRSKATVKRLRMYRNSKERRNALGKIVKDAPFQSTLPSGTMARIEPNRRWFGNTRVIAEKDLFKFQEYANTYDPYQVLLRKTMMPVALNQHKLKKKRPDLSNLQPYFKRNIRMKDTNIKATSFEEMANFSEKSIENYDEGNDGMVKKDEICDEATHGVFRAGRSNRIYRELFKVIDSSDVILYVVDARDPMGTRSAYIENYLKREKSTKNLVLVMNKIDLVPAAVTRQWRKILSKEYPTVAFHAEMNHPIGKAKILSLLRQFYHLHKERKQISVGIIGYPNVGKSSLINTMVSEKACKVAPVAGETKVWQYISLMQSVHLIDCPGIVNPHEASQTELVLKGVVRVERIDNADMHIPAVLALVKEEGLKRLYKLTRPWKDWEDFLEIMARQTGRLLKGGVPDVQTVAKMILTDFQRGRLPYYVKPDGYDNSKETLEDFSEVKNMIKKQAAAEASELAKLQKEMKESMEFKETKSDDVKLNDDEDEEVDDIAEKEEVKPETVKNPINEENESGVSNTKTKKNKALKPQQLKSKDRKKDEISEDVDEDIMGSLLKKTIDVKKKNVKLNSKDKRKMERMNKTKKTGYNYYDDVDIKNKREKMFNKKA